VQVKGETDGHTYGANEQISIELFGATITVIVAEIFG
jgi:hypothetical protein